MSTDPDLVDLGTSDDPRDLRSNFTTQLGAKNKRLSEVEAENASLKSQLMVHQAGLADLSPKQQKAVLAALEGDLTPANLRQAAADLGWAEPPAPDPAAVAAAEQAAQTQQAATTAAQIASATQGAQPAAQAGVLTPEQAAAWGPDTLLRFKAQHPEAAEQLLQGNPVTGITFP